MAGYDSSVVTGYSHVRDTQRGVTLVELIAVMVIIGVLGAVAATRYFDRTGFDADAFTGQVRAMLRYAQKVAVAQNRDVFVRLDGNSVAVCFDSACSSTGRVTAPAGANSGAAATLLRCGNSTTWLCEAPPAGVTATVSGNGALFRFDALGKPFSSADAASAGVSTFQRVALTIGGDGSSRTVTVEPETGYVH